MSDINEIKEALDKLNNLPWSAKKGAGWFVELNGSIGVVETPAVVGMKIEEDTAKFIAKSPEYITSLLTTIESQQKEIQRLEKEHLDLQARAGLALAHINKALAAVAEYQRLQHA